MPVWVAGPGHSLNELTNRLITVSFGIHKLAKWQLYPGPLGLYARHCDDYGIAEFPELISLYNQKIRNVGKENNYTPDAVDVKEFLSLANHLPNMSFYINTFNLEKVNSVFSGGRKFTTILDLPNSTRRHHHLMMEYSTGAADSQDYSMPPDKKILCKRLVKKNRSELEFINTIPSNFVIVNANDLLSGNTSIITDTLETSFVYSGPESNIITQYNYINACTNPVLQEINEMSWQEIVDFAEN